MNPVHGTARWLLAALLVAGTAPAPTAAATAGEAKAPVDIASATRGTEHIGGFLEVYGDNAHGRVLLGIRELGQPFLLVSSLPRGLGSNDVGLDRGQSGASQLVEFRRAGTRLMLVEDNTKFRAVSPNPDESRSAREAFAESVLWAGDIIAERKSEPAELVVDAATLLIADRHGIARQLAATKQGVYEVDEKRSAVAVEDAKSFPDNTELEALLTFRGPGEARYVRDVAMDPRSLSLRQHLSFVRLPPPGYEPRAYHPGSGALSVGWYDFAQPLAASIDVRVQPRFRLEKTDPESARSRVRKPIVFYLDRGAPEPVRTVLLEGARWWASAFEKAGFVDAFRVELLPEGVDPMDARYSIITWAHRHTRGWSYGQPIVDPRTGEIIKGSVTLGSQRVRQDLLIAESLLAPYDKADASERRAKAERMALARLRQLAAHEVGHTLGFSHNFAASRNGNGSVMDYPHPLLRLGADGEVDLDQAYGSGVGPWDDFLVAHAYAQFAPGSEASALASLRADAARAGLRYVSDADAREPGDAEPDALLWDTGADALQAFDGIMAVRRAALDAFSTGVLPPERQAGELEARFVPVYLLHRYQLEAVARLLGGARYGYSQAGERTAGTQVVEAASQRAALERLVTVLAAEQLAPPAGVLDLMTPPAMEYARTREYLATRMAPLFDPLSAAEAAAAQALAFLFAPQRLNRLAWQHARDAAQPGVAEVLDAVFRASWQRDAVAVGVPAGEAVQLAANWVVLDALLSTLDGRGLHAQVDAEVRSVLREWQAWLARHAGRGSVAASRAEAAALIAAWLADPASVKLRPLPDIPPGAPI